jgi:hypothetical protein
MSRKTRDAPVFLALIILLTGTMFSSPSSGADDQVPRTIIALYNDYGDEGDIRNTNIHLMAEMPLNHLGLNVEYHNVHEPLPDIANRNDVRGVLTWFYGDTHLDAVPYLNWALGVVDSGKKFVVMGAWGIDEHAATSMRGNKFLGKIGIKALDRWVENPFDAAITAGSPDMFINRATYAWDALDYQVVKAIDKNTKVYLSAHRPHHEENDSVLLATHPNGGYVSSSYISRVNGNGDEQVTQWLINPFEFFRQAYATDDLPKPDATTIAGRRIFYSNIDGDGWNNVTKIEEYRDQNVLSSRVILDKVAKTYPDLPMTMALIAAEIDPAWAGKEDSQQVAREFLALPNVEAGSHTYSHPFDWGFFKEGNSAKEIPYLPRYFNKTWGTKEQLLRQAKDISQLKFSGYHVPRAYAAEPFDIHKEIEGSIQKISEFLPQGKRVEVLAWSGNCLPWESVIHLTREAKVQNINGGDTRFDPEYPGYASVAPIGKQIGKERQIYVSSSNENTYTNLWSERFFAHKYLKATLQNTETPIRLKPLSIYFHIYAGEREASLNSLLGNFDYARHQNISPVSTSHYTRIAEGFYETQITALGSDAWRIDRRGALETIRFDRAMLRSVDFERSQGVVGQCQFQGSLYVYLDADVAQPVIALKDNQRYFAPALDETPYLLESRWLVSGLKRKKNRLDFTAQGYGAGDMVWQMPAGTYRVSVNGKNLDETYAAGADGLIALRITENAMNPLHVTIERI